MYRSGRGTAKGKARRWEWAGCSFTPASYSEPCPFRLPRTLEASQRKMHSTVLDLGRSSYPCVCSTATEIPSTTTLEHGTAIDSDFGAMHGQVALQQEDWRWSLAAQPASLYRTHCLSALWMLIDFAAGGWSQCAQKMTVMPETTQVCSDSTRWRVSKCGALFKLVL
jgi:hypothetical protein